MKRYMELLWNEVKKSLQVGGIICIVGIWVVLANAAGYVSDSFGFFMVGFMIVWPVLFLFDAVIACFLWRSE